MIETILKTMKNKKIENSSSSSHFSDHAKVPIRQITPTYESAPFSRPHLDQFEGLIPTFNKRLSPEIDLGLSPLGNPRLSPETLPRLFSNSYSGIETPFLESGTKVPKTPVGKGLEVKPDLAGRTLSGAGLCSLTINADLPISPFGSRLTKFGQTDDELKKIDELKKKIENKKELEID